MRIIDPTEFTRRAGRELRLWQKMVGIEVHHNNHGKSKIIEVEQGEYGEARVVRLQGPLGKYDVTINEFQVLVRPYMIPDLFYLELTDPKAAEEVRQRLLEEAANAEKESKRRAEKKLIIDDLKHNLSHHLDVYAFDDADRAFEAIARPEWRAYYNSVKIQCGLKFLSKNIAKYLGEDWEKARALIATPARALVTARAGSGKTTLIGAKVTFLSKTQNVSPERILVLAFNKPAAAEIGGRIREEYGVPGFHHARTFHSFAYRITNPTETILYDGNDVDDDTFSAQPHGQFVQGILRSFLSTSETFRNKLYEFFRKEAELAELRKTDLSQEEYYVYRRNLRQVTLDGQKVRSLGEKIIGDFLFEHGIRYKYEDAIKIGQDAPNHIGTVYRPDFTLFYGSKAPSHRWEHWGIDEKDPTRSVPPEWGDYGWEDYRKQMDWKRSYWRKKRVPLIETSIVDNQNGREAFEAIIRARLEAFGIYPKKKPKEELMNRVLDLTKNPITPKFQTFIQRAKQAGLTPNQINERVQSNPSSDQKTQTFSELACQIYSAYEEKKTLEKKIDFTDLLIRAAQRIDELKGDFKVQIADPGKAGPVGLNDMTHIFIDEYQDFSELFFRMLNSMARHNPKLRIYAVGDDWQAINAFAGSNLKFFGNFDTFFPGGKIFKLLTNHRSKPNIVKFGNQIMAGKGEASQPSPRLSGGTIKKIDVTDTWMNVDGSKLFDKRKPDDTKFTFKTEDGQIDWNDRMLTARYLKNCCHMIEENNPKSVLILSRKNKLPGGIKLDDFKKRLVMCFPSEKIKTYERNIVICNAHQSKGLEAEDVYVLRCVSGEFPLIHQDNELYRIFGRTAADELEDERRLFYVACTRAKKNLVLLTERGEESDFLRPRSMEEILYSLPTAK